MKTKKTKSILCNLDCVLDTRLGTIAKIDNDKLNTILTSGKYHVRDCDEFDGIDRDLFIEMYKNRDTETLALSMITNIIPLLKHFIEVINKESNKSPLESGTDIEINYYPYKLSEEEIDFIKLAMGSKLLYVTDIKMVNLSPTDLNPKHCKTNYAIMIMYGYTEWIEANKDLFKETLLPEVTLFVPGIYFEQRKTDKEIEKITKEIMAPMKAIELLLGPIVNLQLIDVKYFSIISDIPDIKA